jgi:hypothetical protein
VWGRRTVDNRANLIEDRRDRAVSDAKDLEPQLKKEGWRYEKVAYTDPITLPVRPPEVWCREPRARTARCLALAYSAIAIVATGWFAFDVGPIYGVLAIVLAGAFSIASMHATGETDNTPAGPLGGLAQVAVGAIGPGGVATPLFAGGVVNGVASHSAQMLDSWKTGEMVGGSPPRVLVAQMIGIAGGVIGGVLAYWLIVRLRQRDDGRAVGAVMESDRGRGLAWHARDARRRAVGRADRRGRRHRARDHRSIPARPPILPVGDHDGDRLHPAGVGLGLARARRDRPRPARPGRARCQRGSRPGIPPATW